ncbi:transposase InsO family protein [Streptomyces sp. TE33382]
MSAYLAYWLDGVAVHHLRENTHTRYAASIRLHLIPGLGAKKLARLTARDVRTFLDHLRSTCQCCAQGRDTDRRSRCTIGQCCEKRLSPLTVTYVHAVLKSALEQAVREDELPRNVARNVKTTTPRPRRFQPLTATEARQFLHAANGDRLHALYELALRTGLRKGELLGLHWEDLRECCLDRLNLRTPSPDLIGRDFTATRPGTKTVGDITYIPTAEGWLCLASWLDLATREVIGYSMADHHRAELVVDALDLAAAPGRLEPGCVVHSDRGSEYASRQLRDRIAMSGNRQSMGRTGRCSTTPPRRASGPYSKRRSAPASGPTARAGIFDFIETFHNRRRLRKHVHWGYLTPHETRLRHQQDQALAA